MIVARMESRAAKNPAPAAERKDAYRELRARLARENANRGELADGADDEHGVEEHVDAAPAVGGANAYARMVAANVRANRGRPGQERVR